MDKTLDTELAEVRPKVMAVARKFFRASKMDGDPEDVVQDVLLRLWDTRRKGISVRSPEAWATATTKNCCISLWRKRTLTVGMAIPEYISDGNDTSRRIEDHETQRIALDALKNISPSTLRLLQLRSSGLSLDEIAAITGRTKGSVKSSISAARKEMTRILKQE